MYLTRKVQVLKVAVEPALSGCVMVVVCWYLALTGEDLGATIPWFPFSQGQSICPVCQNFTWPGVMAHALSFQYKWISVSLRTT